VLRSLVFAWCTVLLVACNPVLNWREVHMHSLVAMLPCKPDQAQRMVQLAAQDMLMDMRGCEADGALFAISHVRVDSAARTDAVRADWRQQTLAAMRAPSVQALSLRREPRAPAGSPPSTHFLAAQGQRPDGSAVVARLLWLGTGPDLYHVAVYANSLTDERVEMLFSGLRLQ